jgi:pimeloyl-ACP methyl ester carboxylesterase
MFNPSLPHLLDGTVDAPALIVWGRDDQVVPLSAAAVYQRSMKNSRLVSFETCGHRPEVEASERFVLEVRNFLQ